MYTRAICREPIAQNNVTFNNLLPASAHSGPFKGGILYAPSLKLINSRVLKSFCPRTLEYLNEQFFGGSLFFPWIVCLNL